MSKPLQCRLSGDLLSWERHYFEAFLRALQTRSGIQMAGEKLAEGPVWILSRDWRTALKKIPKGFRDPVFVSVLAIPPSPRWLGLFPRRWNPRPDLDVRWLAHSEFSFRFLKEMESVATERLTHLPLPGLMAEVTQSDSARPFRIGFLNCLNSDANLSFLMSVAHYVSRVFPEARFAVPSTGRLANHLQSMARDMGLESSFVPLGDGPDYEVDLCLFAPLKCEHYTPLLWLGATGIPALATDVPGIESLISDGHDGFVLAVNDVKPVGELIVRLAQNATLRQSLGQKLRTGLAKRLPLD